MSQEVDAERKARNLIDGMLENSGWDIIRRGNPVPNKGCFAVEEVDTPTGLLLGTQIDVANYIPIT